jgi:hypothetical protein
VEKEARKDALAIQRAAAALAAGAPPGADAAREVLAAARAIDREFLSRVGAFPVRIDIRYEAIEPLRLRRIELGLEAASRILEGWGRGRPLREAFAAGELERRLLEILRLYAEETLALSHGVRLARVLAPLREHVARRLRASMLDAARSLARDGESAVRRRVMGQFRP